MRREILVAVLALSIACSTESPESNANGTWVGTITTEGNVTTVINESGSVWGGNATLIEELSIGVETGPAEYMFGRVGATASYGNRIYVSDLSVPAVRMYTLVGEYVGDIGREGQGPGEYTYPSELAVSDDGQLFVYSRGLVIVYSDQGEPLHTYRLPRELDVPFIVTADGTTYGGVIADPEAAYYRLAVGLLAHGPEGPYGETLVPPRYEVEMPHIGGPRGGIGLPVAHAEEYVWTMDRRRNLIAGASGSYTFKIARPDGASLLVERVFDPVPVSDQERAAAIRSATDFLNRTRGDGWRWDGPLAPNVKPAFVKFMPTWSGELWVLRAGAGENYWKSSWRDTYIVDAFDRDLRYLGEVEFPAGTRGLAEFATDHGGPFAFVRGNKVLTSHEDEAGTIMVKRYRLVLPGEE